MKQTINDFINSIDTKLYSRIRESKGDAECRRYLKEYLAKQSIRPFYCFREVARGQRCIDCCTTKGKCAWNEPQ